MLISIFLLETQSNGTHQKERRPLGGHVDIDATRDRTRQLAANVLRKSSRDTNPHILMTKWLFPSVSTWPNLRKRNHPSDCSNFYRRLGIPTASIECLR